jgi:hypothetical protein
MEMIEQMAREYFPNGFPETAEQWLDFAEYAATQGYKKGGIDQHRKTWALAVAKGSKAANVLPRGSAHTYASENADLYRAQEAVSESASAAVAALPCPPIEATKDK